MSVKLYSQHMFWFSNIVCGLVRTGRMGLRFCGFYVQERQKAQPAVVLVLKCLRRRVSSNRLGEAGN